MMTATASELNHLNQELELVGADHPNVLVAGSEAAVVDALQRLRATCRQPVATCEAGSWLVLPPPSQTGALILRDVGNLTRESQGRLMAWLDDTCGRTQVIATSATALWPQVEDGAFPEALYYRINVIYIDLTDGPNSRGSQPLSP